MSQYILNMQNEFEGKTVEEAIELGLQELSLSESEAEIKVVDRGNRGIFGIGGSTATVRITKRTASSAAPQQGVGLTEIGTSKSESEPEEHHENVTATATQQVAANLNAEPETTDSGDTGTQSNGLSASEAYDEDGISDDDLSDMAMDMLGRMVSLMGYDVEITATWRDPDLGDDERGLMLDVSGDDLGALIGRHGETLSSLQYLLRLMVNQKVRAWCNIVVDVASYKSRRAEQLIQLANRVAEQVAENGRSQSLEPMPSNERRIVHLTLRDHEEVYTESTGDSDRRKVHVVPKSLTS